MAFATKTDYCGLATVFDTELGIRDANKNESSSTYAPVGADGSILAIENYGKNASPSNSYALKANLAATAGELKLGKLTTISNEKFVLRSVTIGTGVNSPVTIQGNAELVEDGFTEVASNLFTVPAFTVNTTQVAQDIFSAFTLTGAGANLTQCNAEIAMNVGKDTLVGVIISNGNGSGTIKVTGTILMSGSAEPTVAAATGWVITKAPTCTNPETAYRTYTFELQKALAKVGTSSAT